MEPTHAIIVGGHRDGEIVPVVGRLLYEVKPTPMAYFGPEGQLPKPDDLMISDRVYVLQRLVKILGPVGEVDNDIDLDPTQGWRYVPQKEK